MNLDWYLVAAAFGIGIVVGLTGMGGGALMTPALVLFFGVPPLAAVSSDLVAAAVAKPVGAGVHLRRGHVRWELVSWLTVGSVPFAFFGVLIVRAFGQGEGLGDFVRAALGVALLFAAFGLGVRAYLAAAERRRPLAPPTSPATAPAPQPTSQPTPQPTPELTPQTGWPGATPVLHSLRIRPLPTVLVGALGGLVVGMTSVGSGSLMIIALMALYPGLLARELVGTDLVQAVPLVVVAAAGHLLFGDVRWEVTVSLLIGAVPGAFVGAQLSSNLLGVLTRRALAFVLLAAALRMLGVPTEVTVAVVAIAVVAAAGVYLVLRRRAGEGPGVGSGVRESVSAG